jgi:cytochrome bd-type quinol oxidase subunit 2
MGDDIGWMQPSIYHRGLMNGETPNIDRIGHEGAMFTDYYAEQSCTVGRCAFFTGMKPLRAGMILPQIPGSPSYLQPGTPSLARFLLDLGYNTGEFGKNHLGDWGERRWGVIFPLAGILALAGAVAGARRGNDGLPFVMAVLFLIAAYLTLGVMFWPYMIPYSVTVANAAAPEASLAFLFYGAGIFVLPVIAAYTIGVYWIFRGKVQADDG